MQEKATKRILEDSETKDIVDEIIQAIRAIPSDHDRSEYVIEIAQSRYRVLFQEDKYGPPPVAHKPQFGGCAIRKTPDDLMGGVFVRIAHEPPLKPYSIVLLPEDDM